MRVEGDGPGPAEDLVARRSALLEREDLIGRHLSRALVDVTDAWFAALFSAATKGARGGSSQGLALLAVGGYGRGELAPGSDLDVLLLHDRRRDVQEVAQRLWYPVWDSGLKLGHAVRTLREALALAASDLDTATALLDVRLLAGDAALAEELAQRSGAQWRKRGSRWLDELGARVAERHAVAGEVAFLLEPDIKEARGGLRDVHALRWAEAAERVLLEGDDAAVQAAAEVLVDVRVELHRLTRRPTDQLLLQHQDDVATAVGAGGADELMRQVAEAARTIAWTSDETWDRIRSSLTGPLSRVARRDRDLGPGLVLRDTEVHLLDAADPAEDPTLLLRTAACAARARTRIDRHSLDRLAARTPVLDGPWPDGARVALVDLLVEGRAAIPVWEALDQRRLIERILPEWSSVRSKPQRNAYHRFTVDRHLCESAAEAAALTSRVARPDLLLVAAWLHDIGKGWPGDHTDNGVELVADISTRVGFAPADVSVLVDLVRHHLLLPDVATRRDLGDPATIEAVTAVVGSLRLLELLAALTEADSIATGPAAWGRWKSGLLATLVARCAHVLTGGEVAEAVADGFPDAGLRALMAAGEVVVRGEGTRLTVVAPDRPGLFSRVAGVLTLRRLPVLGAAAHSEAGIALSVYDVDAPDIGVSWDTVVSDVDRALAGRLAVDARLVERARAPSFETPAPRASPDPVPRVSIDNEASATSTVVEVRAPDDVGVLYRITRALADLDLDIRHARVQTIGPEVIDTFYVRGPKGGKLVDPEHLRELERAVLHHLAG